jgi:hypothetical protein
MKLKTVFFLTITLIVPSLVQAQSKTTEALQKEYKDALSFFFYNNTLRMLNQEQDKEFDELIKDIEKMRFLMIRKNETPVDYKKLVKNYRDEAFEEIITSRHEGKSFNVYLKEQNKKTTAMLVLINDSTNLYVLDILGSIALDKVTKLYSTLDESANIGKRIKAFTGENNERDKKSEKEQ